MTATDVNGAKVQYTYYDVSDPSSDEKTMDLLKSVISPNNVATRYSYFTQNDRTSTVTVDNTNVIAYEYARGMVTGLSRRNSASETTWQRYKTTYNAFGQKTSVAVENVNNNNGRPYSSALSSITLATYTYAEKGGHLTQMTYGNGAFVKYSYDILDRPIKEVYYTSSNTITQQIVYVYNAQGALGKQYTLNGSGNVRSKHVFTYDSLGRLIYSTEYDGNDNVIQRIHQTYDKSNRLSAQSWTVGSTPYSESYIYNDPGVSGSTGDGTLQKMTISTGNSITFSYDSLKRLSGASSWTGNSRLLSTFYSYKTRTEAGQTYSTSRVNQRNVYYGSNLTTGNIIFGEQFEYDDSGNIIAVYERRKNTPLRQLASYDYDNLNQLTQEVIYTYDSSTDTTPTTTTYLYTYDSGGNIKEIKKNNTVIKNFTYGNSTWHDQLTKVGNLNLTYDAIGNPTNYGNSHSLYSNMTWENGRQLSEIFVDGPNDRMDVSYGYDAEGIRTQKVVNGVVHNYITQNGKVVRETIGTGSTAKVLDFIYDNNGQPFSLIYTNGTAQPVTYYYVLNYQGDVVNLVTAAGSPAATYRYNAWGEILSVTNANGTAITNTADIAHINPLRYRGYYYDSETGFYYLQSRYYDPANCRFINADSYASTGQGILGTNMYAYCYNCPVLYRDDGGQDGVLVIAGAIGVAIDAVVAVICVAIIYYCAVKIIDALRYIDWPELSFAGTSSQTVVIGSQTWVDERQKEIRSYVKAKVDALEIPQGSKYEKHHIVARTASAAEPAREILNKVFPDNGTEIGFNYVYLKYDIHRHIHTSLYYELVNVMIVTAYDSACGNLEQQRVNVIATLESIKLFLLGLNELVSN